MEMLDNENVVYIDEYPRLAEKVRLRRLGQQALFSEDFGQLVLFPVDGEAEI